MEKMNKLALTSNIPLSELTKALNVKDREFAIIVYGKGATEQEREAFSLFMATEYPRVECYEIDGEQDVYDFILIVE